MFFFTLRATGQPFPAQHWSTHHGKKQICRNQERRGRKDFSSQDPLICTSSAPPVFLITDAFFLINNAFITLHYFSLIRNPELIKVTANFPFSLHFCPGHHQVT